MSQMRFFVRSDDGKPFAVIRFRERDDGLRTSDIWREDHWEENT